MKRLVLLMGFLGSSALLFAQAGHIMQGIGATNMSMGGAATAQPLDISGALHWNPAAVSVFDETVIKFDIGAFFSNPELSASLPADFPMPGAPALSGITKDDRGVSPMPALAMVWGKKDSKHTFGASIFGVSGFGVTFPEEVNNPLNPAFDPTANANPINFPQAAGGFGRVESDYMMVQGGFTWSYELAKNLSVGVQPTVNFAQLKLQPNPTADPGPAGYPSEAKASAWGFGGQVGLYYQTEFGLKLGASYKTPQWFGDFEFENTFLDGSEGKSTFRMDYPAIASFGVGYSKELFDVALDYRFVDYQNTKGFEEYGWTETAAVKGFGWENVSIISAGFQLKAVDRLPIRVGYTFSTNPIKDEFTFFNVPATAIIKHAFQIGLGFNVSDRVTLDAVYHHGMSDGKTTGSILNPMLIDLNPENYNPYGAIPGSEVGYKMSTDMVMLGFSYTLSNR